MSITLDRKINAHHLKGKDFTRRGIAAMTTPYTQVAAVFSDFQAPVDEYGHRKQRGGYRRDNKTPRNKPNNEEESVTGSNYHVEASFTDDQMVYVGAAIAGLNTLAQGRVVVRGDSIANFSQRVEDYFRDQSPPYQHFSDAVISAILELYTNFGIYYPNLTPALGALSSVAGIEGTKVVIESSAGFLNEAIKEEFGDRISGKMHHQKLTSPDRFTNRHANIDDITDQYEVWCSGQAFGTTLIRQAEQAALRLADDTELVSTYTPSYDTSYSVDTSAKLTKSFTEHIFQIVTSVKQQYAPV